MIPGRRIALVCQTPIQDFEGASAESPSYGIRRIQAAVLADPQFKSAIIELIDVQGLSPNEAAARIEAFDPDIVGMSVYIWSFVALLEVARMLKESRPDRTIVFGGPSARPAMFWLEPHRRSLAWVDAICTGEGEEVFCEIASLEDRSIEALSQVRGIAVPRRELLAEGEMGWHETPRRPLIEPLDRIASPYVMGLMPRNQIGYFETYRGCPLNCRFCEWGIAEDSRRVFSKEYIARELRALRDSDAFGAFNLDAGLNLNAHGFRNLRDAEKEVGFFKERQFVCEVYPSLMKEEYYEFLSSIRTIYIGIGLQSFNKAVLDKMDRPFMEKNFETVVGRLSAIAPVEIQMIYGLPGDYPQSFRDTFERARKLPAAIRVYHCLVMPDALMTRGLPEFDMKFDPYTLLMTSCQGWSEDDFAEIRAYLLERAQRENESPEGRLRLQGPELPTKYWIPFNRPPGVTYNLY